MGSVTTVYRLYGEGRQLLYVGITDNYAQRMRHHAEKFWWVQVRQIETCDYEERSEALAVEAEAIRTEDPIYNRQGRPKRTDPAIPKRNTTGKRELISIDEAAEYLGVNPKTIRRRIGDGTLTAYRMGPRLIRVDMKEVDALLSVVPTAGTFLRVATA